MKTYTLTHPAYGQPAGTSLALDDTDPLVQMNVTSGVLVEGKDASTVQQKMTCPICADNLKQPPKLSDHATLEAHYEDKHPGFVVPSWMPDKEDSQA